MRLVQALLLCRKAAVGWVTKSGMPKAPVAAGALPLAYGNGRFVAMDNNSVGTASYVSTDGGVTWLQGTMPSAKNWVSVAFGKGMFVAISAGNPTSFATSTDGLSWSAIGAPLNQSWTTIAFGNNIFVATAIGNTYATCVTPGSTGWTTRTFGNAGNYVNLVYVGTAFVLMWNNTAGTAMTIISSTDGINWGVSGGTTGGAAFGCLAMAYGNGICVSLNSTGSLCTVTTVGSLSSSVQHSLPVSGTWKSIAFGGGKFIALDSNSSAYISSTDGVTWQQGVLPTTGNWSQLAYGAGNFIALIPGTTSFLSLAAA